MILNTVKVSHNSLTPEFLNHVKNTVLSKEFPWFSARKQEIISPTSVKADVKFNYSWEHWAVSNSLPNSKFADLLVSAAIMALENANIKAKEILRVRVGLHSICHPDFLGQDDRGAIHIDSTEPHNVGLLYLNNCNGDTHIYNEIYDPQYNLSSREYLDRYLNNRVTIRAVSSPKENKLICFNGRHYHTGGFQTDTSIRVIINFNYI